MIGLLASQPLPADAGPRIVYHAMIEALDAEIGRLLGSMEAAVADLAGVGPSTSDGESFRPFLAAPTATCGRSLVWSEKFEPNGHDPSIYETRTLRDERYKLIRLRGARDAEIARIESAP